MAKQSFERLTEQGRDKVKVIYDDYIGYVRYVACTKCGIMREDLEEVVQEAFLAVSSAVAKGAFPLENGQRFKWFETATKFLAMRFIMKRNAHGVTQLNANTHYTFASEEELDSIHNDGEEPFTETLDEKHNAQIAFLPQAVAKLPMRERVILEADLRGESRQEAAKLSRIPTNQIGMYAKRGRERLLAMLSQETFDSPRAA